MISDNEVPDILVVEDTTPGRDCLAPMLRSRNYRVRTADCVVAALREVRKIIPDLILLDLCMPRTDGIEVCRELRQTPDLAGVPIILMSARDDLEVKLAAFDSGANDYVTKPCQPEELLARVQAQLKAKSITERLCLQAGHDMLTGLPNHAILVDRLQQAINYAERYENQLVVACIELERPKSVDDHLSLDAVDRLVKEIAHRLRSCARKSDTIARIGSDKFVIAFHGHNDDNTTMQVMQRVLHGVSLPFGSGEERTEPMCNIGLAIYPQDGGDVETLLAHADLAMCRAKELGRNNFQFYASELNERINLRLTIDKGVRQALEREELVLHYQPRMSLRTGSITGVEALIRWQHPEQGLLPPAHFLPIAEESGLGDRIGKWVLHAACRQLKQWQQQGLRPVLVTINISSVQFLRIGFARTLEAVLAEYGIAPPLIELDFKESLLMQDPASTLQILEQLKQIGVGLSIDDFGTGFSNFAFLKRFPVDRIKLDPTFIAHIEQQPEDLAMVDAVISLAHSLGMRVVVECAERGSQLALLADRGCDDMQGDYFSPAVSAQRCTALLQENRALDISRLTRNAGSRTVLLLEQEGSAHVEALAALTETDRCRLFRAVDTHAAFSLLASHEVNVVVCDHTANGIDVIEFLRRVRQMYPKTVRIMLAAGDTRIAREAINIGAVFRCLPKPCQPETLVAAVDAAFTQCVA